MVAVVSELVTGSSDADDPTSATLAEVTRSERQ
jgi:hypothetical protein